MYALAGLGGAAQFSKSAAAPGGTAAPVQAAAPAACSEAAGSRSAPPSRGCNVCGGGEDADDSAVRRRDGFMSLCTVRVLVGLLRQTVTLHSMRLLLLSICNSVSLHEHISLYTYLMLQVPGATLGPGFPDHLTT